MRATTATGFSILGSSGLSSALRGGQMKPILVEVYTSLMSNRFRVVIMLATALMLGAEAYGHAFDISHPAPFKASGTTATG